MLYLQADEAQADRLIPLSQAPDDAALADAALRQYRRYYQAMAPWRDRFALHRRYYQLRHWQDVPQREPNEPRPVTPVLFATYENILADMVDALPDAAILGETAQDTPKAERLQAMLRFVLQRRDWQAVYTRACATGLLHGTIVFETGWDTQLYGGLGDVSIQPGDITCLSCDPYVQDINDSPCVIKRTSAHLDALCARYPDNAAALLERAASAAPAADADTDPARVDVLDFWWREYAAAQQGHTVHMARIAAGVVLEKKLNVYAHGLYPFITQAVYPVPGQLLGMGLYDLFMSAQGSIDLLDQAMLKNALTAGKVKLLLSGAAQLDEDALLDWQRDVVRGTRIDEGAVRWFAPQPLPAQTYAVRQDKIALMKSESGQNEFVRGESAGSITAASAILALQEAGSKRSRLICDRVYDAFKLVARQMLLVMAQRYRTQRVYRLSDQHGLSADALFDPADFTLPSGRLMDFDIRIQVQKASIYKSAYHNELVMRLVEGGHLDGISAVELMDIDRKAEILRRMAPAALHSAAQEVPQ